MGANTTIFSQAQRSPSQGPKFLNLLEKPSTDIFRRFLHGVYVSNNTYTCQEKTGGGQGAYSVPPPQFFPLTLFRSKRGEGPSRTLNRELLFFGQQAGFSPLCRLISNSPPFQFGIRVVTPGPGVSPLFSVHEGPSPRLAFSLHLCWGPGARTFRLAASAGIFFGKGRSFSLRRRRRGAFSALSTEKSVLYGSKRNVLAPGPWQSTRKKLGVGKLSGIL